MDSLRRQLDGKAEKQEIGHLGQEVMKKADKKEIDLYVMAVTS